VYTATNDPGRPLDTVEILGDWSWGLSTKQRSLHWRHAKIFWDTKVTEYVETMPHFVINFWGKKLTKISLFKDISWNQKFKKRFFFPMVFLAKKLAETTQLFFHCYHHISEENMIFEMTFWSRKTSKKKKFGNIFWCNKWNRKWYILLVF